jgi:signal transduction histidine kinase
MRRRLVLMAAATTSMVVVAFVVPLGLAVQTIAANEALNEAETEARSLAPAIATVQDPQLVSDLVRSASATSIGRLTVFMPDGVVMGAADPADPDITLARTGRSFTTWTQAGADVLVPVVIPQSGVAVIEVEVPSARLRRGVAAAWTILAAAGIGLVLLAVFVADRIARGVVVPTKALAHAAEQVAGGELQTRVEPAGPREVLEVGRAFNLLVGRINELLRAEREAAADLSHRLRTPLTALRLDLERIAGDPAAKRIDADVQAVEQAVSDVIRELRDSTRGGVRPSADLVHTVGSRMAFWTALAREQGRPFELNLASGSRHVHLPRDEIDAIVDVLIGNIFAHTSESTPFRVAIEPAGDQVRLVVEDEGPGFPAAMMARGSSGGGSTGLGLDIARRAAESAAGSLSISARAGGGGRVEVCLPIADRLPELAARNPRR